MRTLALIVWATVVLAVVITAVIMLGAK